MLKEYASLLKLINDYVTKMNLQNNQNALDSQNNKRLKSKGSTLLENENQMTSALKEQDRLKQNSQLRLLIAIVVSTISNYVDSKEPIIDENRQLDLIQKDFFFDNILQLMRRLILKSQSQA